MKTKSIAMILAMLMLVVGLVSTTLAWLTDKTDPVSNTFTTSDIAITLEESPNLDLKMVPGYPITKDPKVTVKSGSEKCYVFVKIEKSANYGTYLNDYALVDGWTKLTKDVDEKDITDDIYYVEVDSIPTTDWTMNILKDNKVTVKDTVTKADMQAIDGTGGNATQNQAELSNRPTLTFTAYATQLYKDGTNKFTPAEAWANVSAS